MGCAASQPIEPSAEGRRVGSSSLSVSGSYECHLYDGGGKNDWHYVTISEQAPGQYLWSNRAGVAWSLTAESYNSTWGSYETGDICCGPGSYYLSDPSITERHEDVTTLDVARARVETICRENPDNPVVMWQLTNPWGGPASGKKQHLVFHRQKFASQNLDADSGRPLDVGFALSASTFANGRRWGSPMFFRQAGSCPAYCNVGSECPYFKDGHSTMTVVFDAADSTRVVAVLGPWDERYDREGCMGVQGVSPPRIVLGEQVVPEVPVVQAEPITVHQTIQTVQTIVMPVQSNVVEQLERLSALKEQGLVNDQEFETAKAKLLM